MEVGPAKKRSPAACILPLVLVTIALHCLCELLSMSLHCVFWIASMLFAPFIHLCFLCVAIFALYIVISVDAEHSQPGIEVVEDNKTTLECTQTGDKQEHTKVEEPGPQPTTFTGPPVSKKISATTKRSSKIPVRSKKQSLYNGGKASSAHSISSKSHSDALKPTKSTISPKGPTSSIPSSPSNASRFSTPPSSSKTSSPAPSVSPNISISSAPSSSQKWFETQHASEPSTSSASFHGSSKTSPDPTAYTTSTAETDTRATEHKNNESAGDLETEPIKKTFVNFYELFDIPRDATTEQVSKAYKKMAIKYHPDKMAPEDKEKADEMFKLIGEAAAALKNDKLRTDHNAKIDAGPDAEEEERPNRDPVFGVTYYEILGTRNGATIDEVQERCHQILTEYDAKIQIAIATGDDVDELQRQALYKQAELQSATVDLWDPVKKSYYDWELWMNWRMVGREPEVLRAVVGGYVVVNIEYHTDEELSANAMQGPQGEFIDAFLYSYLGLHDGATMREVWEAYARFTTSFTTGLSIETSTSNELLRATRLIELYNTYMAIIGEPLNKYWYDESLWRAGRIQRRPAWTTVEEQAARKRQAELEKTERATLA
ncbi:DnaJ-domain-containing protein [Mytilinidion resinicola]|uniref:DnaJ-domain-containing protein n=1 Tax=Mytilinidion resinicola TaxID=574789 RepID=A0A6A6Y1P7_9PEZI|nr:DnaJ-domain-containing protein [Mytilinidion resinicola]KAF2802736.1 DnaJ-domain-containing protein [Mytilinidion resinicola]